MDERNNATPQQHQAMQQGQAPYGPPPTGTAAPPAAQKRSLGELMRDLGVLSLILGVVAILGSFTVVLGLLAGLAAIVLAVTQFRCMRTRFAIAGLSCGATGVVLSLVLLIAGFSLVGKLVFVPRTDASFVNPDDVSQVSEPVERRLPATVEDDVILTFTITSLEFDSGEIVVHYSLRENTRATSGVTVITKLESPDGVAWTINGQRVEPALVSATVYAGESTKGFFYFDQAQVAALGIESLSDFTSLHGVIHVSKSVDYNVSGEYDFVIDL